MVDVVPREKGPSGKSHNFVMGFGGLQEGGTKSRPRMMTFKELVTFLMNDD